VSITIKFASVCETNWRMPSAGSAFIARTSTESALSPRVGQSAHRKTRRRLEAMLHVVGVALLLATGLTKQHGSHSFGWILAQTV
jgi:hypothetical protein